MTTNEEAVISSNAAVSAAQAANPLGSAPVGKLLLSFSIPSIIACLVNSVYNIVDQIFIGHGVGYLGNAATTVAFPVMTIIMAFATLIGSGGGAFAAIKLGQGKKEVASRALNNLFLISLLMGLVITILGLIFLDPILRMFGATETVMPYARDFTSIILLGVPFNILGISLSNMARTDGNPRMSMYGILIGAALNTILDPIYIFVFHWGVKGAAIATITSQIISAVILTLYFVKRGNMRLNRKAMRPSPQILRQVCALGSSSGVTQLVACVMQVVMNNTLVYYGNRSAVGGDVALSAMGIVMKIAMILGSVCIGIGIGSQPILGFNFGARKYERIRKTYLTAVVAATIAISIGWLVCQTLPELILQLFGGGNEQFMDFGVKCMRIYLCGIFCAGFQIVSTSYFQATGQPLKASLLSTLRQLLLLIPLLLILPLFLGLKGVLFSAPAADIGSAIIVLLFILPEMKKINGQIRKQREAAQACSQSDSACGDDQVLSPDGLVGSSPINSSPINNSPINSSPINSSPINNNAALCVNCTDSSGCADSTSCADGMDCADSTNCADGMDCADSTSCADSAGCIGRRVSHSCGAGK